MQAYLPPPFCRVQTAVAGEEKRKPAGASSPAAAPVSGLGRQGVARQQLVGVYPAGQRGDAVEPASDAGIVAPADAELVGKIEIAAQRQVGDGGTPAEHEGAV